MTGSNMRRLAVIGGGPAGLMAAEVACAAGLAVDLYEAKGSVGRKFLIAGKGGLNLTHSDPMPLFAQRYRERQQPVAAWLQEFNAEALRDWARGLGVDTYVGSSGRVFPMDRKAAPLLRGWVRRLKEQGVVFHVQHRWLGWSENGAFRFDTPTGAVERNADAAVLALGGGSWPQLGSDGQWQAALQQRGIAVAPLVSANCGFDIDWSAHFVQRHAGAPLKPVVAHWQDRNGLQHALQGECVATANGIEGSLIYAMAADLREQIEAHGVAELVLDLIPGRSLERVHTELSQPRKGRTFSENLRRQVGIDGVKAALLYEHLGKQAGDDVALVARTLKQLPLRLLRTRPIAEAISSAGGVRLEALDDQLMALAQPGVFCAGEMLDWEAPTGGYLLTACFASGLRAARGAVQWLQQDGRATDDR
ncbi:TPA: TIGR03862 family flavoprotein [Xanthomonas vasicola pv. zeae]|uniref:Aminoacetone oxidase family FAD-binding enzyme n=1 Tax=Xanthomonas vasicola pv. vasculorum TaxID=325776 RepID=A0AAE8F9S9_XANVA|nr:TIGR03862 family flavoprotein [Xanthomonas vasicola]AVQ07110.1 aminoacetone oxidase family FAD-binding enzyme [Xanthomonas vasicola pv. vasculorum]AZM71311.1 aminoacetone oxidase family FAD-binding enzyme [Xanthomonas vasicola pv. vasculorum]KFA34515.1 NAD(FAD)-utilizing dehydrogenase [Xanthomonas vasicola pv. vasculorum NCPPB 206]MDO6950498.1 TIGR03862 family flavoprotein [Xanthomonas vasicola]MDO6956333.1 TIGR03862 family flavoprotein [Xanthomonas vasicola]